MGSSTGRELFADANAALRWVWDSDLPQRYKQNFARFIKRFPSFTFTRDSEESLDEVESRDGVVLPSHIRNSRCALSFVHPPLLALFDGYDYECSKSDSEVDIWYGIGLGEAGEEVLEDFAERAHSYVVGSWHGSDNSYLVVDTFNMEDERIFEFAGDDLAYALLEGNSVEEIIEPAFASYSSMLAHIVALRTWEGAVTLADGMG
ncbi:MULTISPECIES: hypothetical protein [Streptomyces]|uniref:hypothetical protein n=1 Tax=Streptomyces TaxID=1883 RepID=UPI0021D2D7CD|nr:hypothetical protein [Streptomyces sp. NEAU-383]